MSNNKKQILILVDKKDRELGFSEKEECHKGQGKMHRAFMVFFINKKGEILLCRRSKNKKLWPGFWDASVVSHVLKNESYKDAALRRTREEIGLKIASKDLKEIGDFSYRSEYKDIGSENEYCRVFLAKIKEIVKPNKEEIEEIKFLSASEISRELSLPKEQFTPWFKIGFRLYLGAV